MLLRENCSFSFGSCRVLMASCVDNWLFGWCADGRWLILRCHVLASIMEVWQFQRHLMTCWNYVRSTHMKCS